MTTIEPTSVDVDEPTLAGGSQDDEAAPETSAEETDRVETADESGGS